MAKLPCPQENKIDFVYHLKVSRFRALQENNDSIRDGLGALRRSNADERNNPCFQLFPVQADISRAWGDTKGRDCLESIGFGRLLLTSAKRQGSVCQRARKAWRNVVKTWGLRAEQEGVRRCGKSPRNAIQRNPSVYINQKKWKD